MRKLTIYQANMLKTKLEELSYPRLTDDLPIINLEDVMELIDQVTPRYWEVERAKSSLIRVGGRKYLWRTPRKDHKCEECGDYIWTGMEYLSPQGTLKYYCGPCGEEILEGG